MLSAVTDVIVLGDVPEVDGIRALAVVPPPGDAPLAARVCAEITRMAPAPPLVIVAVGAMAALLPSVALAQRAARRQVLAYVLVDPEYPAVSEGWPDARVHVLGSPEFDLRTAELRGWETGSVTELRDLVLEFLAHP
jgi:hypothetical protein